MSTMIDMPDKALHEKCGVFGALAPVASQGAASTVATAQSLGELLYYGLYALQHRGQETCGMAVFEHDHLRLHKDLGLVSQVFQDHQVKRLKGQVGVGHTRYSTAGDGQLANAQPVIARTPLGALALAHNGNLINPERLLSQFGPFEAEPFGHESDSWILAQALGAAIERALSSSDHTGSFEQRRIDAVKGVLDACQGAFSIVVAMGDC
ncbi:MAG: hypothetical protein VKJ06_02605, partial [Vampirovibrionales bacterium]|nr:hypothetical protein [Vampirovibrionales bacterium]